MSFLVPTYRIEHKFPAEGIKINLAASDQAGALAALLQDLLGQLKQELQQMANEMDQKLAIVRDDIAQMNTVVGSAIAGFAAFPQILAEAVADALAKGATPDQLQSVTDFGASLESMKTKLADAVAANTQTPPGGTTVGGPSVGSGGDTSGTDPNGAPSPASAS